MGKKKDELRLVRETLNLLREVQVKLAAQPTKIDLDGELQQVITEMKSFLARKDRRDREWWKDYKLLVDSVLTLVHLLIIFTR